MMLEQLSWQMNEVDEDVLKREWVVGDDILVEKSRNREKEEAVDEETDRLSRRFISQTP